VREIELPVLSRVQGARGEGKIIFRDAGFIPVLRGNRITLGPGQLAAIGFGRYASNEYDLGIQEDVQIPRSIARLEAKFFSTTPNTIETSVAAPAKGDLRILFQQHGKAGEIMRSWPGGPPEGTSVGKVLKIYAEQDGKALPIEMNYDKLVWSGLSWGAGEIKHKDFQSGRPITIRCTSLEKDSVGLAGQLSEVEY
jgi:hypothetical protein